MRFLRQIAGVFGIQTEAVFVSTLFFRWSEQENSVSVVVLFCSLKLSLVQNTLVWRTIQRKRYFEILLKVRISMILILSQSNNQTRMTGAIMFLYGSYISKPVLNPKSAHDIFHSFRRSKYLKIQNFVNESQKESLKLWTWSLWRCPIVIAEEDETN
ncbi:Hypothetical_protein [Hexamita inflata]|uniref:Hypothetical_protein n=1 Tax=Hexamita inflata TaxID=28002 RepID=A0AA86NJT3_9EUKA|nr:Hypothetical protein HINF_LOCUS8193 [Hexamita inflata]CAI9920550.1 Hypothetical protein HINF_LOCUS8195 [Hexamita inflata]